MQVERQFDIEQFSFGSQPTDDLYDHWFASELWPVVYLLKGLSDEKPDAYIGETTDIVSRLKHHVNDPVKKKLTDAYLISSKKFNKSATLDLEANLIKYISGEDKYKLLNANLGLTNHTYYQKNEVYKSIFESIWQRLMDEKVVRMSLEDIDNSNLFKYSPYKSLNPEQVEGIILILQSLIHDHPPRVIIEGGAGTGKSILAVFLFKLLLTPVEDFNFSEFGDDDQQILDLVITIKRKYPDPKMALVIPMESFRSTIQQVFDHVKGLSKKMVIGPTEVAKRRYDIIMVDEAHRLHQRKNISYYYAFDRASEKLGLDKHIHTELDWILKQSAKTILFYDEFQSIKPSDVPKTHFDRLKNEPETVTKYLTTQMRVRGGKKYVNFVNKLLTANLPKSQGKITFRSYDVKLFHDLDQLIQHIRRKDKQQQLARMVAGFAWPWLSRKNPEAYDIHIQGLDLKWNSVTKDWTNSPYALDEIGCIHTTQGYDLNYVGVIFGPEIVYDRQRGEIMIRKEHYHDRNGKADVKDDEQLKAFILHIYLTLMQRGIHGTYVYVCDEALRDYFAQYIPAADEDEPKETPLIPFENSVPLYDLSAAAGDFSEQQQVSDDKKEFIRVPEGIRIAEDHFACRVVGESMNKIISNGSVCLFRKYQGGSRNGLIVLAQHTDRQDADFGSQYTVKEYHSTKYQSEGGWHHQAITLTPKSTDPSYPPVRLADDELSSFSVIGIFEQVLTMQ